MLNKAVIKNVERNIHHVNVKSIENRDGKEEEKNGYHCEHKHVFARFSKKLDECNKFSEHSVTENVNRI